MTAVDQHLPSADAHSRWISDRHPDDQANKKENGARVARRNLVFSIFSEHIGFSVWSLWSVLVLFLGPKYHIDPTGKFVLTSDPTTHNTKQQQPNTNTEAQNKGHNRTDNSATLLLV